MDYLLELTKIIDGALGKNQGKVLAYTQQLIARLREEGNERGAKRLEEAVSRHSDQKLEASRTAFARPPIDSDTRLSIADQHWIDAAGETLVLPQHNLVSIERFLNYVRNADRLMAHGVDISPTMILFGPPGCGKTATARWIAGQLGLPLIVSRLDALVSSYLGSTARNIRLLFEHAMEKPCILFLDEIDAIAKLRDDQHELGELKRVVISLLQNIDALDGRTILMAASNHPHLLDPAIWRRFSFKVELSLPDEAQRKALISHFLKSRAPTDCIDLIAEQAADCSGAEIRQICEDAIRDTLLENMESVNIDRIMYAFAEQRVPSLSRMKVEEKVVELYRLSPGSFPYSRLSRLFSLSPATISRLLKREQKNA